MNARVRDDRGFTLIEMLVVMTMATTLLLVLLQGFDTFSRSASTATGATEAQNDARTAVSEMVSTMRQARIDTTATPAVTPVAAVPTTTDVTIAAWGGSNGDVPGFVRYCTTGTGTTLQRGWVASSSATPPAGTCGASTGGWTFGRVLRGTLQAGQPVFTFQCGASACTSLAAATAATGIGIRLAVNTSSGGATAQSALIYDAVSFRYQS